MKVDRVRIDLVEVELMKVDLVWVDPSVDPSVELLWVSFAQVAMKPTTKHALKAHASIHVVELKSC